MANNIFGFTNLTGGAEGALDAITGAADNDMAFGIAGGVFYTYQFDAASSSAESSPNIIAPDSGSGRWIMKSVATDQLKSVSASVGSNALTLGLNPCVLDFRNATLTNGVPNTRAVPAALSLVVPSGATLGTINAVAARLVLLAIDNAGTIELAVVNLAGGNNLDETTLISTTAISDAADAANVIYSETARTNVPFRVVGFVDITEAAAGTWATDPTLVQGGGGQALAAMPGQTYQSVTRDSGTTYYNTTGRRIFLLVYAQTVTGGIAIKVNNLSVVSIGVSWGSIAVPIPPYANYSITDTNATRQSTYELR